MVWFISERFKPYISQFVAVFTATLGIFGNGIEYGWTSPAIPILLDPSQSPIDLESATNGSFWVQTIYIMGGIFALPLTCFLVNKIGRRRTILLGGTVGTICWVLTGTANNIIQLYIARFLAGMGANFHFVATPMYTAEVAQPHIRGFLGTMIQIMCLSGILVGYCIIPILPIWASSFVGMTITLIEICTFWFQPESPYYELVKGRQDHARVILTKLRQQSQEAVESELIELTVAVERQEKERGRFIDLIIDTGNRKATIIMALLNCGQHLSGSSVIVMNIQTIISSAGNESENIITPEMASVWFAIAMILSALFGSALIDRAGRKVLLVSSYILSSIFLGLLGFYLWVQPSGWSWIPLFAIVGYALSFKYGLGLVPIVVTSELFPTSLKAKGMVVSDLWFTFMAALSIRLYYWFSDLWGQHFPFLMFSVCGFLIAVIIQFYMPETNGLSLEEIQFVLKGKMKPENTTTGPILNQSAKPIRYM